MGELDTGKRARLPDSAFAYIDSKKRRRLPINDESHVRNALARFSQVRFESDDAREQARRKLLQAAKKHGIVPIGFFAGQLRSQRKVAAAGRLAIDLEGVDPVELQRRLRTALDDPSLEVLRWSESIGKYLDGDGLSAQLPASGDRAVTLLDRQGERMAALVHDRTVLRDTDLAATVSAAVGLVIDHALLQGENATRVARVRSLPTGQVTFLMTDIENSTGLLNRLDDRYATVLEEIRSLIRDAIRTHGGREVDARADDFFAAFGDAPGAVDAAVTMARRLATRAWPNDEHPRVRIGIHTGRPTLTDTGYIGVAVHTTARVCAAGHGGQIVVSDAALQAAGGRVEGLTFRLLGSYRLQGIAGPQRLHQVVGDDLPRRFGPLRARRVNDAAS